jgi:hypothetical protein
LYNAKLTIPDVKENGEMVKWRDGEIVCYPNPAKDMLNVEFFMEEDADVSYHFLNAQGVTVLKENAGLQMAGWHKERIKTGDLAPGAYFLQVRMGDAVQTKKVIIRM